jgi:hypothetical protein
VTPRQHVATPWRWAIAGSDLDATAKHVLLVVSLFTDTAGTCDPSRVLIAELAGRSVDVVDRALTRGEAAGLITITRSRGRSRNRYHATIPTAAPTRPFGKRQQPQNESPTAAKRPSNSRVGAARTSGTSELGGALDAAAAFRSAAARALPEDDCGRCGQRLPLVDDLHCVVCATKVAADRIINGVRRDLDETRAYVAAKDGRP